VRIYLGGPMFVAAEVRYNLWLAAELRQHGFDVYCPNESEPINDKTRTDITARKIYAADIEALEWSQVYVMQVSEDSGTNWEAGYMDCLSTRVDPARWLGVLGLATDIRLQQAPDPERRGVENQAYHINAFVVGGLQHSLGVVHTEEELIAELKVLRSRLEEEGGSDGAEPA
jgi:hypothetical protein